MLRSRYTKIDCYHKSFAIRSGNKLFATSVGYQASFKAWIHMAEKIAVKSTGFQKSIKTL